MVVIGIETSGLSGSIALMQDECCLEQRLLAKAGQRHAQSLVLEIRQALADHQLKPSDVHAVAVSRGPGSFTGLRVGLVCAKTFAYATGCQFVAVDTFVAIAMNCPRDIEDVWIVEDAQRGDLFAGRYVCNAAGAWSLCSPITIVSAEQWLPMRTSDETITGRGLLRCDLSTTPARCLIDDHVIVPAAVNVAIFGKSLLSAEHAKTDATFDCWKAVPFYLRPSAAEEHRDKRDAALK